MSLDDLMQLTERTCLARDLAAREIITSTKAFNKHGHLYSSLELHLSAPFLHVLRPQAALGKSSGNMTISWTTVGIHILLAWLGLIRFALSDCAGSDVVTLPYENVTVLGASVKRGMQLDIGTSPQRLAFAMAG